MKAATIRQAASAAALTEFLVRHGGDEDEAFLELLGHVIEQGSLLDFCGSTGIHIGVLLAWIRRSPDRSRRYEQALLDRRMLDAESVRSKWRHVMNLEPKDPPRYADILKASEYLAKNSGALNDNLVVRDNRDMSEDEMQAELLELLARNPDVKHAVLTLGSDVVDAELVTEVVKDIDKTLVDKAPMPEPVRVPEREPVPVPVTPEPIDVVEVLAKDIRKRGRPKKEKKHEVIEGAGPGKDTGEEPVIL